MLEVRPNCEYCDKDLPPTALDARICSYECTFCAACVEHRLNNVCPNCGGGFAPRPIRPAKAHRQGLSLAHQPALQTRVLTNYSVAEISAFSAGLATVEPEDR